MISNWMKTAKLLHYQFVSINEKIEILEMKPFFRIITHSVHFFLYFRFRLFDLFMFIFDLHLAYSYGTTTTERVVLAYCL